MAAVNLKSLVDKLNPVCRRALVEGAVGLCLSRTNYNVEIEHLLLKLLEAGDADLPRIFRQYDVDAGVVQQELTRALDKLKTGNARRPAFSPTSATAARGLGPRLAQLPGRHDPLGLSAGGACSLTSSCLGTSATGCPSLAKIPAEKLGEDLPALIKGLPEDQYEAGDRAPRRSAGRRGRGRRRDSKTPALDQFTLNLTERARKGEIDPVIGRDFEIRQVIDILTRRRQNNPILTGEAGVGKTAVVEGFALRSRGRRRAAAAARTSRCARSTWACCRPGPASRASSRTGSSRSSTRSRRRRSRSFCSSTRPTR